MKSIYDRFTAIAKKQWFLGVIIFLILGLLTRFANLENPREIVFDEFHFFHFVSEYEQGEYFFDIHPPLGKLILWANAKMYGITEFIDETKKVEAEKTALESESREIKNRIQRLELQQSNNNSETSDLAEGNEDSENDESREIVKNQSILDLENEYRGIQSEIELLEEDGLKPIAIGTEYHEKLNIWGIRSVPALFGALLVPLMFFFAFFLTRSLPIASIIGLFTLFSPAFITESQYVLMDSMLMFFMVLGTLFIFLYYKTPNWKWWWGVIFCSAVTVSIKWTGLSLIGLAGLVWMIVLFQKREWLKSALQAATALIFVIVFYMLTFVIHFSVLTQSGEGDAFHTPEFRKSLENSRDFNNTEIEEKSFFFNRSEYTKYDVQTNTNETYETSLMLETIPNSQYYRNAELQNIFLDSDILDPEYRRFVLDWKSKSLQELDLFVSDWRIMNNDLDAKVLIWEEQNPEKEKEILDWEHWRFYGKFVELNRQMGERSAGIRNEHPFASRPEDWIKGEKAIYFWNKEGAVLPESSIATPWNSPVFAENKEQYRFPQSLVSQKWNEFIGENFQENKACRNVYQTQIHLFTNSLLWKFLPFSTLLLGVVVLLFSMKNLYVYCRTKKEENILLDSAKNIPSVMLSFLLVVMTLVNIIPFVLIERPQFLYHAFESVLFALLSLGVVLAYVFNRGYLRYLLWMIFGSVAVGLVIFFIIELPLIYGFPFHDCMGKTLFSLF